MSLLSTNVGFVECWPTRTHQVEFAGLQQFFSVYRVLLGVDDSRKDSVGPTVMNKGSHISLGDSLLVI